jgi:hypothetical protein
MQKPLLADPFLFVDDDPVHDRNLPGGAAEAEAGDAKPDAGGFSERDAVAVYAADRARGCDRRPRHTGHPSAADGRSS